MMNVELLEKNFTVQFPEELDGTLDLQSGSANCCKFNRWGTMVAAGGQDGRIFIFDFIAKNLVKQWTAHALPVSTVCWSRDGRNLLTSSADNHIFVWDVLTAAPLYTAKFTTMVVSASFNPRNDNQALVLQLNCPPTVEEFNPRSSKVLTNDIPGSIEDYVTVVGYDRRGKYIITGTSKGKLIIYDSKTLRMIRWCRQNSTQQVKQIIVPRRGNFILTNSQDRVIRTYDLDDLVQTPNGSQLDPLMKIQDLVNKASWKAVCTDSDGMYICGASQKSHSLYIWERTSCSLIKMLNGAKGENLMDVQWHPTRPVILSIANGIITVWTQAHVENWSAFAPEFTELEENQKYIEKEGEFDMEDEDASDDEKDKGNNSDEEEIDVVALKKDDVLCSSDEEDNLAELMPNPTMVSGPLWYLPIAPEVENPEEPNVLLADLNAQLPVKRQNTIAEQLQAIAEQQQQNLMQMAMNPLINAQTFMDLERKRAQPGAGASPSTLAKLKKQVTQPR